jgi:hypothetical protein
MGKAATSLHYFSLFNDDFSGYIKGKGKAVAVLN